MSPSPPGSPNELADQLQAKLNLSPTKMAHFEELLRRLAPPADTVLPHYPFRLRFPLSRTICKQHIKMGDATPVNPDRVECRFTDDIIRQHKNRAQAIAHFTQHNASFPADHCWLAFKPLSGLFDPFDGAYPDCKACLGAKVCVPGPKFDNSMANAVVEAADWGRAHCIQVSRADNWWRLTAWTLLEFKGWVLQVGGHSYLEAEADKLTKASTIGYCFINSYDSFEVASARATGAIAAKALTLLEDSALEFEVKALGGTKMTIFGDHAVVKSHKTPLRRTSPAA